MKRWGHESANSTINGVEEGAHKGGECCDVLEPAYDAVYAIKVTSEADASHMDITNQLPKT